MIRFLIILALVVITNLVLTAIRRFGNKAKYIRYEHHGCKVWVNKYLKGRHRKYCLCFSCGEFKPGDRDRNCPIANQLYQACVDYNIVTPVWECPNFDNIT